MAGIFKAYDVRGIVGDLLNPDIAYRIGRAFPKLLENSPASRPREVVVSRDMRESGIGLSEALVRGLRESGVDVLDIGLATTPMNYFAVGHLDVAGGVQCTASHNPAEYNGFKFSIWGARPVSGDEGIPRIERLAEGEQEPPVEQVGSLSELEIMGDYTNFVLAKLGASSGRKLKVVVDAANGMGTLYEPLLERCGIELTPLYFELDGNFPNHEANPLKLDNLADLRRTVLEQGADLGISFDGDADRAAFVDEKGEPLGSDHATALIAGRLLRDAPGKAVVYDVRSSRTVPEYIEQHGGIPIRERVGHSFIKATLRGRDGAFGGELAGHYYFPGAFFADSSMLAVVEILNILNEEQRPLSEIAAPLRRLSKSPEINFEIEDKQAAMDLLKDHYSAGRLDEIDGIRIDFDDWWFNVRPSNTEPLLRLVLEAENDDLLAEKQGELIGLLGEPE